MPFRKLTIAELYVQTEDVAYNGLPYPVIFSSQTGDVVFDKTNLAQIEEKRTPLGEVASLAVNYSSSGDDFFVIDKQSGVNPLTTVGYPLMVYVEDGGNTSVTTIKGKFKADYRIFRPYNTELNITTIPVNCIFGDKNIRYFCFTANRDFEDTSVFTQDSYREVKAGYDYPLNPYDNVALPSADFETIVDTDGSCTFPVGTIIDFGDIEQEVPVSFYEWISDNFTKVVLDEDYDGIILYKSTAEINRVRKENYLEVVGRLNGTFRDGFSVTNLEVTIEYNKVPDFNYVYIGAFKRYYFVTEIKNIRTNVWDISLSVDVLMTYRNAIYNLYGFIDRNQFVFDKDLLDKKRVVKEGVNIENYDVPNNVFIDAYSLYTPCYVINGYKLRPHGNIYDSNEALN